MAQLPGSSRIDQYVASLGQTVFTYTYKIYSDAELEVISNGATLILTTDYTVQNAGNPTGGTITLVVPAALDDVITLVGNTLIERDTTFTDGGDFLASAINNEYDRLDDITSELLTTTDNVFRLATPSVLVSTDVPDPIAGKCLKWNATADALEVSTYDPDSSQGSAAAAAESAAEALASAIAADASATEAEYWASTIDLEALSTDIVPDVHNSRRLGSLTHEWSHIYAVDAYVSDDLDVGDAVNVGGNITTNSMDTQGLYVGGFPDWDFEVTTAGDTLVGNSLNVDVDATIGNNLDVTGNTVLDGTLTVDGKLYEGKPLKAGFSYTVGGTINGGTSVSGAWQTRAINTKDFDDIGCSLSANQITVPAGTYDLSFDILNYNSGNLAIALDSLSVGLIHSWTGSRNTEAAHDYCKCRFTVAATTPVYLKQYSLVGQADYGLGRRHGIPGYNNVYLNILLEKI